MAVPCIVYYGHLANHNRNTHRYKDVVVEGIVESGDGLWRLI